MVEIREVDSWGRDFPRVGILPGIFDGREAREGTGGKPGEARIAGAEGFPRAVEHEDRMCRLFDNLECKGHSLPYSPPQPEEGPNTKQG